MYTVYITIWTAYIYMYDAKHGELYPASQQLLTAYIYICIMLTIYIYMCLQHMYTYVYMHTYIYVNGFCNRLVKRKVVKDLERGYGKKAGESKIW